MTLHVGLVGGPENMWHPGLKPQPPERPFLSHENWCQTMKRRPWRLPEVFSVRQSPKKGNDSA